MKYSFKLQWMVLLLAAVIAGCKDPEPVITVTTGEITEITTTSAQISGSATATENGTITEIGLCWSRTPNPEAGDDHIGSTSVDGILQYTITGLEPETEYHVRAYALFDMEYSYGEDVSFVTEPQGLFSVAPDRKVRFSKGNLQYQASTNTWRFAERQWDHIGYSKPDVYGATWGTVEGSSNHLIGPDYDGWIDLFGWGTSGFDHGANCYQPWSTSTSDQDYFAFGFSNNDIYGQADWGANPIVNGGNQAGAWRTLSMGEWRYLLDQRDTPSGLRYVPAIVNGFEGVVLFPDDWDKDIYPISLPIIYAYPNISPEEWELLEENGAVFLPPTGERDGTDVSLGWCFGGYWTSSHSSFIGGMELNSSWFIKIQFLELYEVSESKHFGCAVRLVQDYPFER